MAVADMKDFRLMLEKMVEADPSEKRAGSLKQVAYQIFECLKYKELLCVFKEESDDNVDGSTE